MYLYKYTERERERERETTLEISLRIQQRLACTTNKNRQQQRALFPLSVFSIRTSAKASINSNYICYNYLYKNVCKTQLQKQQKTSTDNNNTMCYV